MDPIAAKYIGAGIACIGMGGAGAGVGIIFGNYLAAAVRNPSAAQGQFVPSRIIRWSAPFSAIRRQREFQFTCGFVPARVGPGASGQRR